MIQGRGKRVAGIGIRDLDGKNTEIVQAFIDGVNTKFDLDVEDKNIFSALP